MVQNRPRASLAAINFLVVILSMVLCSIFLTFRIPGMTLLGCTPQWLLMWVVVWSIQRETIPALVGAIAAAWVHDSLMVTSLPSHLLGFVLVAYCVSRWRRQRPQKEDFILIALIVFPMAILAEGVMAFQQVLWGLGSPELIWNHFQRIGLATAFLSSLWSPVFCLPLLRWWDYVRAAERR